MTGVLSLSWAAWGGGRHASPPAGTAPAARSAVRQTDWRFLLPPAVGGRFERLVVLGGPRELAAEVRRLELARRVSVAVPEGRCADAVACLCDAGVGVADAARCLKPGGVMYYEVDRHRAEARGTTPSRLRRELRAAGLSTAGVYWVRDDFADRRAYLPAEVPAAAAWYFANVQPPRTRRELMIAWCASLAAALGAPPLAERAMRCFAATARCGAPGTRAPSVLTVPALPGRLRAPGLRPVVVAPRIRRVVFLPFEPRGRAPVAALKVSRFTVRNDRAENEQRALAQLRSRLDARLRLSVPEPLGAYDWGALTVGVESCIRGRALGRPRRGPPGTAVAGLDDLRAVADWLGEFHRQSLVARREWDEAALERLERALAEYERAFGVAAGETALFARARGAARALLGAPVPTVWCHGDLAPGNVYRGDDGIAVIDWEHGAEGLPLLDLLFFVEEWLYNASGAPTLDAKLERFGRVFVGERAGDLLATEVRAVIGAYMARLELDPKLQPVLHVLLRVERAVAWFRRADDPDLDDVGRQMAPRCVGCVRALAAGTERLFSGSADASPLRLPQYPSRT